MADRGDRGDRGGERPFPADAPQRGRLRTPAAARRGLVADISGTRRARQQRALLAGSGLLSALVLAVSGVAWTLASYINDRIGRVDAGTTARPPTGPLNILVAGIDRRGGLTPQQQAELHVGHTIVANSDTMMLVHLSADHTKLTVVSLPRDSWVDIPGHGMNKINAAYGIGGPSLMVATVQRATGLTVNDFTEVDFLAVVRVVDALGGVDICLPQAVDDAYSGLHLAAGKHHVDGITALKYARDRHSYASQDLARITNQQRLLSSLLSEAISGRTFADPVRLSRVLSSVLAAVRVDRRLDLTTLASMLRGISAKNVSFTTVPLASTDYLTPTGESAVVWDTSSAARLFSALRTDTPLVKPARQAPTRLTPVLVNVYNGSLIGGLSAYTGRQLSLRGFTVRAALNWPGGANETTIAYPPGERAAAEQVRSMLPGALLVRQAGLRSIRVVLGATGYQLAAGSPTASAAAAAAMKTAAENACR